MQMAKALSLWVEDTPCTRVHSCDNRPGACHPRKGWLHRFCGRLALQNPKATAEVAAAQTLALFCAWWRKLARERGCHPSQASLHFHDRRPKGEYIGMTPLGCPSSQCISKLLSVSLGLGHSEALFWVCV